MKLLKPARTFTLVMIALFVALQYALWFSPGGLVQILHLKKNITNIDAQNAELAARNAVLEADVNDLKQGKEAIAERARNDLGMIKKGETFYQVAN